MSLYTCVSETKSNDASNAHVVRLVQNVVGEKGERGVALVAHSAVHDTARQERTTLDVVLRRVQILRKADI